MRKVLKMLPKHQAFQFKVCVCLTGSFFDSTFEQLSTGDARTLNVSAREMRAAEAGRCVINARDNGGGGEGGGVFQAGADLVCSDNKAQALHLPPTTTTIHGL